MTAPTPRGSVTVFARVLPEDVLALRGVDKVAAQRAAAHRSRASAAARVGLAGIELHQAVDGRPLPAVGWHWSQSHGGAVAAAALHRAPVGVDVEPIVARREDVVARVLDDTERAHLPAGIGGFTRAWTAKEAVLKATQLGLAGLRRCRIVGVFTPSASALAAGLPFDEGRLVELDGVVWRVHQREHAGHVLAVTTADAADGVLVLE